MDQFLDFLKTIDPAIILSLIAVVLAMITVVVSVAGHLASVRHGDKLIKLHTFDDLTDKIISVSAELPALANNNSMPNELLPLSSKAVRFINPQYETYLLDFHDIYYRAFLVYQACFEMQEQGVIKTESDEAMTIFIKQAYELKDMFNLLIRLAQSRILHIIKYNLYIDDGRKAWARKTKKCIKWETIKILETEKLIKDNIPEVDDIRSSTYAQYAERWAKRQDKQNPEGYKQKPKQQKKNED